jgi:Cof subfamily protein (haloacid dehalogenase superfamily)
MPVTNAATDADANSRGAGPSRFRAVFVDLDGTLVGGANRVAEADRNALLAARAAGCEVVLCTGRSRISTEPVADQLGFRGWVVLSNGAVAMHLGTREVLYRNHLPTETALDAVRVLLAAGAPPQVYEDAVESARILYHPDHPVEIHNPERQRPWPRLTESLPFPAISVSSYGPEEHLRPLAERLAADPWPGTFVEQAGTHAVWCLEVHHEASGKGRGLRRVADRLGVPLAATLAIGDHMNDLGMLRAAGLGVAMGSGLPEVRAAAAWVTGSLAECGVAQALRRFLE